MSLIYSGYLSQLEGMKGLVFLGCGGSLEDWVKRIFEESSIPLTREDTHAPFFIKTSGGRRDLVFLFKKSAKIDIQKLNI